MSPDSKTLVVTDLDGTLWDESLRCHPDTLEAVQQLLVRPDIELLVATGRRRNSALRAFEQNGLALPAVLLNGAKGFDVRTDQIFHQATFRPEVLAEVLSRLDGCGLSPVAYLSDTRAMVVEDAVTSSAGHLDSLGMDRTPTTVAELAARDDVLGMSMLGIERRAAEPALSAMDDLAGVECAAYADHLFPPFSVMLAPDGVTKEVGIRAYLAYAELEPDRIIALGDGGNDLEMLAMADVALAIESSEPRAVAAADHLIPPPAEGGWAQVLRYL